MVDLEYVVIEVEVDEVLLANETVYSDVEQIDEEIDEQDWLMLQTLLIVDEEVEELFVICLTLVILGLEMVDPDC